MVVLVIAKTENLAIFEYLPQSAFTWSKLTVETVEI